MKFRAGLAVTTLCVAGAAFPIWAHHSHGQYEDTFMDIEGVVKEVHLVVPIPGSIWRSRIPKVVSRRCGP